MKFVIDLDDTISDTDGYSEQYIKNFIAENNLPIKFLNSTVRFADAKFDWTRETAIRWYKKYGDEMMLHFPIKGNAVKIINSLYAKGHEIIICTARDIDWHTDPEGITKQWLEDVGLKYTKLYVGRFDKEKVCEEENADVFIDDDLGIVSRVKKLLQNKVKTFLVTSNYNKDMQITDGVIRVSNFTEILNCLNIEIDLSLEN